MMISEINPIKHKRKFFKRKNVFQDAVGMGFADRFAGLLDDFSGAFFARYAVIVVRIAKVAANGVVSLRNTRNFKLTYNRFARGICAKDGYSALVLNGNGAIFRIA